LLLLFLLAIFVFGPDELAWWRQKLLSLFCALLAGLFAYFLTGNVSVLSGRVKVRATGGFAVFILVLWWWGSPSAPVKVAKITANDVALEITLTVAEDLGTDPARLAGILRNAHVEIRAVRSEANGVVPTGWVPSRDGFHLKRSGLALMSRFQDVSDQTALSTAGAWASSLRRFTQFTGEVGPFEDEGSWRGAMFEARLTAVNVDDVMSEVIPLREDRAQVEEAFRAQGMFNGLYHVSQQQRSEWPDYIVVELPILAELRLFRSGALVGTSKGILVRVWEHDEDVQRKHVIAFPVFGSEALERNAVPAAVPTRH